MITGGSFFRAVLFATIVVKKVTTMKKGRVYSWFIVFWQNRKERRKPLWTRALRRG